MHVWNVLELCFANSAFLFRLRNCKNINGVDCNLAKNTTQKNRGVLRTIGGTALRKIYILSKTIVITLKRELVSLFSRWTRDIIYMEMTEYKLFDKFQDSILLSWERGQALSGWLWLFCFHSAFGFRLFPYISETDIYHVTIQNYIYYSRSKSNIFLYPWQFG